MQKVQPFGPRSGQPLATPTPPAVPKPLEAGKNPKGA